MPKGEHFKKPNPRIHQVSFKLNATELAEMKRIVSESGKSLPQFLRDIIFNSESVDSTIVKEVVEKAPVQEETKEEAPIAAKPVVAVPVVEKTPEPTKPVAEESVKKERDPLPKHEPRKDSNNQFSLF